MGLLMHSKLIFRPIPVSFLDEIFGVERDWPMYVKELRGKSGVYVIRDKDDKRPLYVGESHTGRLKKTLLRHFQAWSGKTAGPTYSRSAVEIAVLVTDKDRAVTTQNKLIDELEPRDNRLSPASPKKANDEEEPF
jgi:excinuclease UvrABC nuclease subunit